MTMVLGGPVFSHWVKDEFVFDLLSDQADINAMLEFEIALAQVQGQNGIIPQRHASEIASFVNGFAPDMAALANATARDGLAVPGLVAQIKDKLTPDMAKSFHFGATSQDVIDSSLMMRLTRVFEYFAQQTDKLAGDLDVLSEKWGNLPLMAVTRQRDALPMTIADRVKTWRQGVDVATKKMNAIITERLPVQLGGPIGRSDMADTIRADLAGVLALRDPGHAWHSTRDPIQTIGGALCALTAALGKIGADLGRMSQDGVRTATIAGGGSSAMAHKVNPVDTELLVALSSFAATMQGGLAQASVHEYERSGTSWTLEWLILPQMVATSGAALKAGRRLLGNVERLGQPD